MELSPYLSHPLVPSPYLSHPIDIKGGKDKVNNALRSYEIIQFNS